MIRVATTRLLQNALVGGKRGLSRPPQHLVSAITALSGRSSADAALFFDRRCFSADSNSGSAVDSGAASTTSDPSVEDTLNQLFAENNQAAASATTDALQAAAETWSPVWYNVADQAIVAVKYFHEVTGLEYGWSIIGVTVLLRLCMTPLMIQAQRSSSRMAHLQPELNHMKARLEAMGSQVSRAEQVQFGNKMKALFKRYEVNPMSAMVAPVVQLPLFMGMFFGLQKMDKIYPEELANGGILWFPDLTASDPYYALPIMSGLSFLTMIELGKEQMTASNPAQGAIMLNMMRGMSFVMVPFLMTFDTSMLCYWTANNALTVGQNYVLQQKVVRDACGIWERPKPVPGTESPSLAKMVQDTIKTARGEAASEAQEIQRHNQTVETKKRAASMMRQARQKRQGITGNRND